MPDDREIFDEDLEPNPESEVGNIPRRAGDDPAGEPSTAAKAPGGSGATPRKRNRHPRAYRHEDDDEAYDAIDDGPVEVPDAMREALYREACNAAELAGLG